MAIEKIKKIIFTLICIVLVASVGVVAYAAWDDVAGKKTGDLGVNTGNKTDLTCAVAENTTVTGKYLVPFGTVNFVDAATKANPVNFFSWKLTPKLSDTTKKDPVTGNAYQIKYSDLTITVKDKATGATKASNKPTAGIASADTIFSFWLTETAPPTLANGTAANVIAPANALPLNSVLTSSGNYYFVIRFKNTVEAANVAYSNCTIDITVDMVATSA